MVSNPTSSPAPDPELALLADQAAVADHRDEDATPRHQEIASVLWPALRRLGVTGGRMLVMGEDAEVYAGLPAAERRLPHGMADVLTAPVPTMSWPHTGLLLRRHPDQVPVPFDVVIINVPFNDIVLRSTAVSTWRREYEIFHALTAIELARPGGMIALLASGGLLDSPDRDARLAMEGAVDLLGAIRMPAGALRRAPGNDGPVDLLLMRRTRPVTTTFAGSWPVVLDGHTVYLAGYFDDNPDHVLGTLTTQANPWGPPTVTVRPDPGNPLGRLRDVLDDIVEAAHERGPTVPPPATGTGAPDTDTSAPPDQAAPLHSTGQRGSELDQARAVVARLRADQPGTRPPAAGPGRPSPGTEPDPDPPGL